MIKGTIQLFLDWQTTEGLLPFAAPPIGYTPSVASQAFSGGSIDLYSIGLADYQILGLITFCDYIGTSNDLEFASTTWPKWQLQVEWILSNINATTGLVSFNGFTILGPANGGSVSSCSLYRALNQFADIATAINQTASATTYRTAAQNLGAAINAHLWNPALGVFSWSSDYPNDYSTAGLGFCLLLGVANKTQAALSISALCALKLGPGYKDNAQVNSTDPTVNISPFTNGFILSALLSQNSTNTSAASLELMKTLWGAMLASNLTSPGASWEYVDQSLEPGLGLFTSLSHPWGGALTYLLTEWAAGLRQAAGVPGFGYGNWIIDPSVGISMGLKMASASVVTAFGGNLELSWQLDKGILSVLVHAPSGTKGTFMGLGSIDKLGMKSMQGQTNVYKLSLLLK
jgi:hypothetical protein